MKRFYKTVSIHQEETRWSLLLDKKPVRTPEKNLLLIPGKLMAQTIQKEWDNQQETILPDTMPISQILMTVIDRVTPNRQKLEDEIRNYINTDLICYQTSEPEIFAKSQQESWQPFRDWINKEFSCSLKTTTTLAAIKQDSTLHSAIKIFIKKLNDFEFTSLYTITLETGSIFLGVAFLSNKFSNTDIFRASMIEDLIKDDIYHAEQYGLSPDQERRRKKLETELETCRNFMNLMK